MATEKNEFENDENFKKFHSRTQQDLDLKKKLLAGPELFITEKGTDEHLDKLSLRVKLLSGEEFILSDFVATLVTIYESKFSKTWFYKLADIYGVDRKLMDEWVKPDFVRQIIVQFVYGRFPYSVIRMLKKNKKSFGSTDNKLYHLLTPNASNDLDIVIREVYDVMSECENNNPAAFKLAYSNKFKVYFQTEFTF